MHSVVLKSFLLIFVHVYTSAGFLTRYATDVEGTQTFAAQLTHSNTLINVVDVCVCSHMQHKCSTPGKCVGINEEKKQNTCGYFLSTLL